MKGTVSFYNSTKGYGFIKGEDGTDYFFHVSGLAQEGVEPNKDDEVEFTTKHAEKGPMAQKIKVL